MPSRDTMSSERAMPDREAGPCRALAVALFIVAGEAICVWLGFVLGAGEFDISPFWPAAGFGIAVVTLFGYRVVPLLVAAVLPLQINQGFPWDASLLLGANIGLGAALGAWLLRTYVPRLGTPDGATRDALLFLLLAVVITPFFSAVVGAGGLWPGTIP